MNKLLRRPHWQVFIYTVLGNALIPSSELGTYIRVLYGLIFLVWVLKVNEELYRRSQGRTIHSLTIFQTSLLITFCYISFILLFTDGYSISSGKDNYAEYGWLIWIYIPFSIFIPVSALYAIYFTSSLINQLERELFSIKEDNSFLLFAALFFFPIGIWWVQPRINRILKTPIEEEKSSY